MHVMENSWREYNKKISDGSPADLGFDCSGGDVNRFYARYRLASSFREAVLEGYSPETVHGYSSVFRLFLVWSAFEQFTRVAGLRKKRGLDYGKIDRLFSDHLVEHQPSDVAWKDRDAFLNTISMFLDDPRLAEALRSQDDHPGPGQICRAIRHTFAHGPLTVHAGSAPPAKVAATAEALSVWLLEVMAKEFEARINDSSRGGNNKPSGSPTEDRPGASENALRAITGTNRLYEN
jgi:hypothetical protein